MAATRLRVVFHGRHASLPQLMFPTQAVRVGTGRSNAPTVAEAALLNMPQELAEKMIRATKL